MEKNKVWVGLFFLLTACSAWAQCPSIDFTLPSDFCNNQAISFQSTIQNASGFSWDFCDGSIKNIPSSVLAQSAPLLAGSFDLQIVQESTNFFAFTANLASGDIGKLNFGASLENNPTVTDLGNFGIISGALGIGLWQENNLNYALVATNPGDVFLLSFGNSFDNIPTGTKITGISLPNHRHIKIIRDGSNVLAFIAGGSNNQVSVLNFGSTITSTPAVTTIAIPNSSFIFGIDVLLDCNKRYIVSSGYSTGLHILQFTTSFFTAPTAILNYAEAASAGLSVVINEGNYHVLVSSETEGVVRFSFGNSLTNANPTKTVLGLFSTYNQAYGFRIAKSGSQYYGIGTNYSNGYITVIKFPKSCNNSNSFDNVSVPSTSYASNGTYSVTLFATGSNGEKVYLTRSLDVNYASTLDFSVVNQCANNDVFFTPANLPPNLISTDWSFGDSGTSSSSTTSHQFSGAGTYTVNFSITNNSGCSKNVSKDVQIFSQPTANFTLPAVSPFCTNQNYVFSNTTTSDNGSSPTWQWKVNGSNVATTKDLNYLFTSSSAQTVSLVASIPGCSDQSTQNMTTLVDGPLVSFNSPLIGCQGSSIQFTNTTTDPVQALTWTFGDGNTSSQTNASNSYSSTGTYLVKLSATNAAGCKNSSSKNISIYSVPQPDFSIEGIPSSCANSLSQFDNLTPPLIDSNITSWSWAFGDTPAGASTLKNPPYTYSLSGNYNVSLQATSNFGCAKSVQKSITIFSSPRASFINSPACVSQSTKFTDASTGSISFYQWNVQNSILSGTSPNYTFNSSGTFPVTLSVTGNNGCINQVTKNIVVPVMPIVDFSIVAPCTGHPSVFQELNSGGTDPAVAWNWNFGQSSAVGSPTNYQFPTEGGYTVTMTTTRLSGCSYSASKNILISAGPVANFIPSLFGGAAPLNVKFNNSSKAETYLWQFDDTNHTTSSDPSPEFIYTQLGKYKALLTAKNSLGCSDTLSTEIDVVIPRIDIVMNNFSMTNDPNTNSSKAIVTILNSGNIPLVNPEVSIDLAGGATIKEKISGLIRPGKSIIQTLALQIVPRSLEYICAEVDVTDDVNTTNNKQCVSLTSDDVIVAPYPNPSTSGQVTLEWVGSVQENVLVTIFRSNGEIVFEQNLDNVQEGLGQLVINTASFANGLYLIRFAGSKTRKTFRIAIAN